MSQREHEKPNYREIQPPTDKKPENYTFAERRAELYDMIEAAGHYRNLERTQRELGKRYDVSHTTVQNDIQKILEWQAENIGENAEQELIELKNSAVKDLLEDGKKAEAYKLAKEHYEMLMDMGVKDRQADKQEITLKEAWKDEAA